MIVFCWYDAFLQVYFYPQLPGAWIACSVPPKLFLPTNHFHCRRSGKVYSRIGIYRHHDRFSVNINISREYENRVSLIVCNNEPRIQNTFI
ncbi:unknown [Clostridium sp. CAG:1024]|nr:unknown [Clostridium sp. CAG:1024]